MIRIKEAAGLFLAIFCFTHSIAQTTPPQIGKLSGQIVDAKNKPVEYATVTLLRTDSTVVNGDLTKENGSFIIEPTGTGNFIVRVNIIGFQERFIDKVQITAQDPDKKLGKITINATSQSLAEVNITGEKALMEMSIDKKVFNVEKNITSTGGSATDVLRNIPSLAVDVDGDILLRGKETTILIDGKPATLLGGDIASALQSLPSSSIQSVEVITNPSAKYDAQGMAGIINIITKRNNKFGMNGSASLGGGTRDKYNGAFSINLKNNRWNLFFNSNFRLNRNYQRTYNERFDSTGLFTSASYENNTRVHGGMFNTLGAEYTINEKTSVTLTQNINKMLWGNEGRTDFLYFFDGLQVSSQIRSSDNLASPISTSTSLDYKQKFSKPRQELTANITFARTDVFRESEYITNFYDKDEAVSQHQVIQKAPSGGGNTSLNGQADFTMPFLSKDGKLDAGWKSQLYWFASANSATVDTGAGFMPDPVLQNDFDYTQQIHALYTSIGDQKGKFGYQLGLRMEASKYEGTSSLIGDKVYTNAFLNLFPSTFLSYKTSNEDAVYVSYTRRINRPNFFQMMPYVDVSNPMDTSRGNPDLIPEFIHNSELNYSRQFKKGHNLMASAYLQYTENLIDRIRTFYEDNGTSSSMPQNLNKGITYGFELTGKTQINPAWDATVNFNFFQNEIYSGKGSSVLNNNGTSWFTKMNSNLKLPHNFSLQFSGTYEAPKVAAQGRVLEVYWLDIGIRKNLLNNQANIVLNVSDIFNTRKTTNTYDFPGAFQSIYRDRETRIANVTFTYRFGKSEMKSNGKRGKEQAPVKDRDKLKQGDGEQSGF